jgi:tetratricopeptide (TPR) repeat protein
VSQSAQDPVIVALRAELAAIAELLEGAPDQAVREAAKRRIVSLFRSVEATLSELTQLKENIRELVDRYKRLPTPAGTAPLHRDHLGASTFVDKGWNLLSSGNSAGAIQALTRALELSPGDLHAESLLGWAQMESGRVEAAFATFSRVLNREPANAVARMNLGYLYLKQRAFGEAIEHLATVIRLDSDPKATLYAHYYLGLVYLERGMFADAQSFLARAIALGPNLIEAYHDLGRAQWFAGQREEARATWSTGAAGRLAPWARRCQELLDRVARGEEVPRSAFS